MIPFCFLLCAAVPAQDDPFETRLYNVEFLTREIQDHPGISLSLAQDAIGTTVMATEFSSTQITGEDLASLIQMNIAEDTWEHVSAGMQYSNGTLTVTNLRSVHGRIAQYLAYWRGLFGKMITIDALVVSVDPEYLAKLRAAGRPERPAILPQEHVDALLAAAREGKLAAVVKAMRVTAHPGQRVHMADLARRRFVRDHDVQIATGAVSLDPIVDLLTTGVTIDVRPYLEPFGDAVTLVTRIDRAELKALEDRTLRIPREVFPAWPVASPDPEKKAPDQPVPPGGTRVDTPKVHHPKIGLDRVRTTLTVRNGETAIAGTTFRGGRGILYLLRPTVVRMDEKAPPEPVFDEERLLKLYDISPLTRGVQDWAGPRIQLASPYAGGGPLTGATFTLDEPAVKYKAEDITEMIRNKIAPRTWGNRRNSVEGTDGGTLVVRQRPEVLREIERFLDDLVTARAQMITTEAVLVAFRGGARAEWEGRIPALRPGGYFVTQEQFEELFAEAVKGGNVRLIETGEVTSFPQERVYTARLEEEQYLADYEPQVATVASQLDPIADVLTSGFVLDVRPHFVEGTRRVALDLRTERREKALQEAAGLTPGAGPLQLPSESGFARQSNVMCKEGHWTLVGIDTRGAGEAAEHVALLVRARPNLLR